MNIRLTLIALLFTATAIPTALFAADIQQVQKLHKAHCFQCHGNEVYNPKKTKLSDQMALLKRVTGCSRAAGADWTAAEIKAVADYLNQTYYQFP